MKKRVVETAPAVLDGEWLTLAETRRELKGVSQSTVERKVKAGVIQTKLAPRPGRKPERLYRAADVKRLAVDDRELRIVKPSVATQLAIPMEAISSLRDVTAGWGNAAMSSLRELMTEWRNLRGPISPREKLWLTIDEAVELSGRSYAWLLRACQEGRLTAEKDGGWRILRKSLEAFAGEGARSPSPALRRAAAGAK